MKSFLLTFIVTVAAALTATATTDNIAPLAKASASSSADGSSPAAVNDGVVRISGKGEWASGAKETFWGEIDFPWVRLDWEQPVEIGKILLYDRSGSGSHAAGVTLHFSDGTKIDAGSIPEDGSPREVILPGIKTDFVKVEVTDGYGDNIGFSEIEVYPTPGTAADYVAMADPYIETTRGRYFFFISGCQPQGMIGAAPLTRNKNQGGGGYNYNDSHILGFPQIHAWMLSGLTLMPSTTDVDPSRGEQAWKSRFRHEGEVVRPGYHRLYLEDPRAWVEQTSTMRSSFYRVTYSDDCEAALLLNLGGHVGTSTMVDADVKAVSDRRLEGSFNTVGRLWGGPDSVKVYFVAEFDRPFSRLDSWNHEEVTKDVKGLRSNERSVPRNEGMTYHDAPTAGLRTLFDVKAGEPIGIKMAISYVSPENAVLNLSTESPDWDFDAVAAASRAEWNDWFGRIDVKGGSERQRVKFYTDLWHTLLGRHRIDDVDGRYPDRTDGVRKEGKDYRKPEFRIRQVPLGKDGKPLFGMYNSDALWLADTPNESWGLR